MFCPDTNHQLENAYEHGKLPTMVYINKQNHARKAIHRPLHRHDSICELLLVYRGTGTYYVNGKSYPLSEGSVIYYNQETFTKSSPRRKMRSGITASASPIFTGAICRPTV